VAVQQTDNINDPSVILETENGRSWLRFLLFQLQLLIEILKLPPVQALNHLHLDDRCVKLKPVPDLTLYLLCLMRCGTTSHTLVWFLFDKVVCVSPQLVSYVTEMISRQSQDLNA
jgi:hypothetical protein